MADNKVLFRIGTYEQYNKLSTKDPNTLYFVVDDTHQEIWKGDQLYGRGTEATSSLAGLLSAQDKAKLDALFDAEGGTIPSYEIEQVEAEGDALASYKLKKIVDDTVTYVGDTINIPKDQVLSGGSLAYVAEADTPYAGAEVGDPYLDLTLNNADSTHIYIPVKGLVDIPGAGDGITVVGNIVSIKLDEDNAHGLKVGPAGLALDLATSESDGAMSAADKKKLDTLSAKYLEKMYEVVDSTNPRPLVNYGDGEIRIMFQKTTEFRSQQVGAGGDSNSYYTNFKAYAPEGAAKFKEFADSSSSKSFEDVEMEVFEGNSSAGIDAYGRKYTNVWLPVASKSTGSWSYFGANSTKDKYIGWYYGIQWYDENEKLIGSDIIRINLTNEDCHNNPLPYYMGKYALKEDVDRSLEWGAIEA